MPVSSEISVAGPYYPNGATTSFAFDFKAASADEVVAVDADGNTISPALYSVALDDDEGGTLSFGTAPLGVDYPVIYVVSDPELTQPSDFDNSGPSFNPAAITRAFDRAAIRDLKLKRQVGRAFSVPFGESGFAVPAAADRANKFLSFLPDGSPLMSPGTGADSGLREALGSVAGGDMVLTGDGKSAQQHFNILTRASAITPQDYAAVTPTDWASTFQDTIDAALSEGKNVEIPEVASGYEIGSQVLIKPDLFFDGGSGAFGAFSAGPAIRGRGEGMTKIISKVANAAMFKFESDVDHTAEFGAILGLSMSNVRLSADSGTAGTSAVELQAVFGFHMHDFAIDGFERDGIKITCDYGDLDGSVYTKLERGRIFNCERWGIDSKAAVGHNEISYLSLDQVWIQSCGTAQTFQATPSEVNYPTSGGMRWKGQMLMYTNGGFTTCQGVGLFVPGESSGSASEVIVDNFTHENCVGRGLLVTGCKGFRGRNLQFYNNDSFISRRQCEFYPVQPIYDVEITGGLVRATSANNQVTAFKSTQPASADTRLRPKISQITFDNFGHAGQVGFDGIAFEACRNDCIISYPGGNIVKIEPGPEGNQVPLRLRQPVQGSAFDTGELITHFLRAAGYTADLTGLPNGTYHLYLADAGNVVGLEVSGVAPAVDVLTGILAKPTEQKTWVGRAVMAAGALVTSAAANFANAAFIKGFGWQWVDSTGAVRRKATAPTSDTDGTLV